VYPVGAESLTYAAAAQPQAVNVQDQQDVELLSQIAGGDRSALAALYQRHGRVTFAQIYLLVGDRGMSEEILQDTMLAVWHGAGSFRGQSRVRSWIISIARRRARDRLRKHQTRIVGEGILADLPAEEPGPEDVALARAKVAEVASAIGALELRHREVMGLVFGAGLTLTEAAEVLEVPVGTVKSRLASARAALTRTLSEKGYAS
jgi:RNA polymerase sigma-70 factor, ECF subfamily